MNGSPIMYSCDVQCHILTRNYFIIKLRQFALEFRQLSVSYRNKLQTNYDISDPIQDHGASEEAPVYLFVLRVSFARREMGSKTIEPPHFGYRNANKYKSGVTEHVEHMLSTCVDRTQSRRTFFWSRWYYQRDQKKYPNLVD